MGARRLGLKNGFFFLVFFFPSSKGLFTGYQKRHKSKKTVNPKEWDEQHISNVKSDLDSNFFFYRGARTS